MSSANNPAPLPDATASGGGAYGGSSDRSSAQPKNRSIGRRYATWSWIVPCSTA
jgi:hypothetical protein